MNNPPKIKKLEKYVRTIPPEDLKKVSGGVNSDDRDRQQVAPKR
jgi:hypothetical protein